jgi:hypothetical protein
MATFCRHGAQHIVKLWKTAFRFLRLSNKIAIQAARRHGKKMSNFSFFFDYVRTQGPVALQGLDSINIILAVSDEHLHLTAVAAGARRPPRSSWKTLVTKLQCRRLGLITAVDWPGAEAQA